MLSLFTDFAPTIRPLDKPGNGSEALAATAPANPADGSLTGDQAAAAARSRSTSAGSSAPLSSTGRAHSPPPLSIAVDFVAHRLPEFDCPSPFVVDGWLAPPFEANAGIRQEQQQQQQQSQAVMAVPQLGLRPQTPQSVPPPPLLPPVLMPTAHGAAAQAPPPPPAQAPSLQNAEAELGSPDLPTMGSEGHRYGSCKPCAFVHTKGCDNGVQCQFCHLCSPGEKKRRQRERFNLQPKTGLGGSPVNRGPALAHPGEYFVGVNNAIW
mmetsp:Transcript_49232/g.97836  ORF Transcript_49232/g.97836 Transcript_49232/m.97836 type:complete len:266 (-) Transcript_49232:89-886(-)